MSEKVFAMSKVNFDSKNELDNLSDEYKFYELVLPKTGIVDFEVDRDETSYNTIEMPGGAPVGFSRDTVMTVGSLEADTIIFAVRLDEKSIHPAWGEAVEHHKGKKCKYYSLASAEWHHLADLDDTCENDQYPHLHIIGTNLIFIAAGKLQWLDLSLD